MRNRHIKSHADRKTERKANRKTDTYKERERPKDY